MTEREWVAKAEWEGGILAALEYGLHSSDLDGNVDPEFTYLLQEVEDMWTKLNEAADRFEQVYDKYLEN